MEHFYKLIEDLGELMDQDFYVDQNHACQIIFDEKLAVQMEMEITGERLLFGSLLCDAPPGKFREEILKNALIANHMNPLELGDLCFVEQENVLSLYAYLPSRELTAEKLLDQLAVFVDKGLRWKEAIESGKTHPPDLDMAKPQGENPFGMKP